MKKIGIGVGIVIFFILTSSSTLFYFSNYPKKTLINKKNFYFDITKAYFVENNKIYRGKNGGVNTRFNIDLDDIIKQDEKEVGKITEIIWDKTKESLEIEFISNQKLSVGQQVYIAIE